jgi:hypothetical protein
LLFCLLLLLALGRLSCHCSRLGLAPLLRPALLLLARQLLLLARALASTSTRTRLPTQLLPQFIQGRARQRLPNRAGMLNEGHVFFVLSLFL